MHIGKRTDTEGKIAHRVMKFIHIGLFYRLFLGGDALYNVHITLWKHKKEEIKVTFKKTVSLILVLCMALTLLGTGAFIPSVRAATANADVHTITPDNVDKVDKTLTSLTLPNILMTEIGGVEYYYTHEGNLTSPAGKGYFVEDISLAHGVGIRQGTAAGYINLVTTRLTGDDLYELLCFYTDDDASGNPRTNVTAYREDNVSRRIDFTIDAAGRICAEWNGESRVLVAYAGTTADESAAYGMGFMSAETVEADTEGAYSYVYVLEQNTVTVVPSTAKLITEATETFAYRLVAQIDGVDYYYKDGANIGTAGTDYQGRGTYVTGAANATAMALVDTGAGDGTVYLACNNSGAFRYIYTNSSYNGGATASHSPTARTTAFTMDDQGRLHAYWPNSTVPHILVAYYNEDNAKYVMGFIAEDTVAKDTDGIYTYVYLEADQQIITSKQLYSWSSTITPDNLQTISAVTETFAYCLTTEINGIHYYYQDGKNLGTTGSTDQGRGTYVTGAANATAMALVDTGAGDGTVYLACNNSGAFRYIYTNSSYNGGATASHSPTARTTAFTMDDQGRLHAYWPNSTEDRVLVVYYNDTNKAYVMGFIATATVEADTAGTYTYVYLEGSTEYCGVANTEYIMDHSVETLALPYYLMIQIDGVNYYYTNGSTVSAGSTTAATTNGTGKANFKTDISLACPVGIKDWKDNVVNLIVARETATETAPVGQHMYIYTDNDDDGALRTNLSTSKNNAERRTAHTFNADGSFTTDWNEEARTLVAWYDAEKICYVMGFIPTETVEADTAETYHKVYAVESCTPAGPWIDNGDGNRYRACEDPNCENKLNLSPFTIRCSVELSSILRVHFFMPQADVDTGAIVKVAVGNAAAQVISDKTGPVTMDDGEAYYEYVAEVMAQDMTKDITVTLHDELTGTVSSKVFTMAEYVTKLEETADATTVALAKATQVYCQYAADKKYGTTAATADVTIPDGTLSDYQIKTTGSLLGVRVNAYLDEACDLQMLLPVDAYTGHTVNGIAVETLPTTTSSNGTLCYVYKEAEILPQDYSKNYTFTVNNGDEQLGKAEISVLAYIANCLKKNIGEVADQNLLKAMYHYWAAADTYTNPGLTSFTIVADEDNTELATALAEDLDTAYGVTLAIATSDSFTGGNAIYLCDDATYNSYGGFRYQITATGAGRNAALHINGSGAALTTAVNKLVTGGNADSFPFGVELGTGYEWQQAEPVEGEERTAMDYSQETCEMTELAQGVEMYHMTYTAEDNELVSEAYAVVLKDGAEAQFRMAVSDWEDTTWTDVLSAPVYSVSEYAQQLEDDGYEVIAITNGGFFDLNSDEQTLKPWGMQICDGIVKQEPQDSDVTGSPNSERWFGMTKEGKYVIGSLNGYASYAGNLEFGVGGGNFVMLAGSALGVNSPSQDHRTIVAHTKTNDLILMTISNGNLNMAAQMLMDLDMDVWSALNLDGGNSTAMYADDGTGLNCYMAKDMETGGRDVIDSLAIVIPKTEE